MLAESLAIWLIAVNRKIKNIPHELGHQPRRFPGRLFLVGGGTRLLLATNNEMQEEREEVKEVRISKKEQGLAKI